MSNGSLDLYQIEVNEVRVFEKLNNKTLLLAEDASINYLLLKRILELKKYTVLRPKNGQEAVDMCRANSEI